MNPAHAQGLEGSQTSPRRSVTLDFALSLRLRDASSGRPGGYVWTGAFTRWQLYRLLADAPGDDSAQGFAHRVCSVGDTTPHRTAARRAVSGSRLSTRH